MARMQDVDPEKWARIQARFAGTKDHKGRPIREGAGKAPEGMKPEHNYAHGSQDEWERSVFENADHFTVFRAVAGERYRRNYDSFEMALIDARTSTASILYAVTASGRSTCIDREKWESCEAWWHKRYDGKRTPPAPKDPRRKGGEY